MQHIYGLLGFEFRLELSTRPENYLGTIETWNQAEEVYPFFLIDQLLSQNLTHICRLSATQSSSWQELSRKMGYEPRWWCLLWPQDWHHHPWRPPPLVPVCDYPARFPTSREVQFEIPVFGWSSTVTAGHYSQSHFRQFREVYCNHHRTFWWKMVCWLQYFLESYDWKIIHRPFWLSPRQVVVIPVAAPYVSYFSIPASPDPFPTISDRKRMRLKSPNSWIPLVSLPMLTTPTTLCPRRFAMARLHSITSY